MAQPFHTQRSFGGLAGELGTRGALVRLDLRTSRRKRSFCPRCGRHVKALSHAEAAEILELLDIEIERLIEYGLVHVIDRDRLCKPSLFGKTFDAH